jgi:hypothetical protein
MSDHVLFNSPAYGEEVANLAGTYLPPRSASICRVRDGVLLGGVVYYNKSGNESIFVHVGAYDPHWLNRDMLYVVFDYPFNQLRVKRVFGMVKETNDASIRLSLNAGFKQVARIDGVYKHGVACLIMRMDREDCRFLAVRPRSIKSNKSEGCPPWVVTAIPQTHPTTGR